MSDTLVAMAGTVVCFDLGGVLCKICHTWQEVSEAGGLGLDLGPEPLPLIGFEPFHQYQDGSISEEQYGILLGQHLGCSPEVALKAHDAIIQDEYPGIPELIAELHAAGVSTCCLSNTNSRHWDVLRDPVSHPGIASLMAHFASHVLLANKPEPKVYAAVSANYPNASGFLFFDDNGPNVAGAIQYGWAAHQIDPLSDTAAVLRGHLVSVGLLS